MLKLRLNTNFVWGSSPLRSPIFQEIITTYQLFPESCLLKPGWAESSSGQQARLEIPKQNNTPTLPPHLHVPHSLLQIGTTK